MIHINRNRMTVLVAVAVLATGTPLLAQTATYTNVAPTPVAAPNGYHWYSPATSFESRSRGVAAVIDATGRYNLNTAISNVENQKAVELYLRNKKLKAKTHYERKGIGEKYYQAQMNARLERRARLQRLAEDRTATRIETYRLDAGAFDHTTGEIAWPVALQDSRYQDLRTNLEQHFQEFTRYGSSSVVTEIERDIALLRRELRRNRAEIDRLAHRDAQKFLVGLSIEAQYPRA